jgi:Cys-rich repeat protein
MSARAVIAVAIVGALAGCARGTFADASSASLCENVTCNDPPANTCADPGNLTVFQVPGTCDNGTCTYLSSAVPCPDGCTDGACDGDPCIGVTCATPPPNTCADGMHLTVHDPQGTCTDGTCGYASHDEPCPNGCADDACNDDPCIGVTCTTPPASYCTTANDLRVFDTPGTCTAGQCGYTFHSEFCAYGCAAGACMNDPCIGVTCTTPPAAYCSGPSTRRSYQPTGTCTGGVCSYMPIDESCLYGCASGVCLECQTTANCPGGEWCNTGTCVPCNSDPHCGASCQDCTATGDHCNAASTACVDCVVDGHCPGGNYCSGGTCATCNISAHCGPSCTACPATTPTCTGTACACTPTSCGAYNQCQSGACVECNTTGACGATCSPCGGPTPYCLDQGATTTCAECLVDAHCPTGETCSGGTCMAGCAAPSAACASGGSQDGACSNTYTITRAAAGSTNGFHVDDTYGLCGRNNDFATVSGCESGGSSNGADAGYRLFMKAGESAHVTLVRGASTCAIGWNGTISLKIYGTSCSANCATCPQTCATLHHCAQDNTQDLDFVAPASGWYVFVVDSRGAATDDVGGVFDLEVKLTCTGACTCP